MSDTYTELRVMMGAKAAYERGRADERARLVEALTSDKAIEAVGGRLEAELKARNEWYGLDNWTNEEVAEFVLCAALDAVTKETESATPDLATQVDNARERVEEAEAKVSLAKHILESRRWELAELLEGESS